MASRKVALLVVVLSCALAGAQELGQLSRESQLNSMSAVVGSAESCSPVARTIQVPRAALERAIVKARLMNLLRESLNDDAKGVVNIAREKEIRKLASKLRNIY